MNLEHHKDNAEEKDVGSNGLPDQMSENFKDTFEANDLRNSLKNKDISDYSTVQYKGSVSLISSNSDNPWFLIGASVIGNGHKELDTLCQDAHKIELWEAGWGIAVVSDGAGSAEKSQLASGFLVKEAAKQAHDLVRKKKWIDNEQLPLDDDWEDESFKLMECIRDSLITFAKDSENLLAELHATLIIIIFSPKGLLIVHIGDGRAGCIDHQDHLISLMTPFEGEQVGETAFITLDITNNRHFIESKVITERVKAFFLLTDGCEKVCWETQLYDLQTGKYIKPNKPYEPFFRETVKGLTYMNNNIDQEELKEKWYNYLENGHVFQKESDDKTMVIGIWTNPENLTPK